MFWKSSIKSKKIEHELLVFDLLLSFCLEGVDNFSAKKFILQLFIHQLGFVILHNLEEWIIDHRTNQDQHQTEDDISPIHT